MPCKTYPISTFRFVLFFVLFVGVGYAAADESSAPALQLNRGVCIDRQLRAIPPAPHNRITHADIRLIKSMGFEYVKMILNPELFKSEDGIHQSNIGYMDQLVKTAAAEDLPVVVCIHPQPEFKFTTLGDEKEFAQLVSFMTQFSRHLSDRWGPDELAFQLMTEPFGSSDDPEAWNYWDRLHRRLWATVRQEMPGHTLILSGDKTGSIDGLLNLTPVEDDNVLYSFTFYEPHLFTQQGTGIPTSALRYLKNLPFPSGPETLTELPRVLESVPLRLQADAVARVTNYANERWDTAKLAARMNQLHKWRESRGGRVRLWCAEFGCIQAAPPDDRLRYLTEVRRLFEQHDIGWAYWSYNETFSIMTADRTPFGSADAQTPDKELLKALLPDKQED